MVLWSLYSSLFSPKIKLKITLQSQKHNSSFLPCYINTFSGSNTPSGTQAISYINEIQTEREVVAGPKLQRVTCTLPTPAETQDQQAAQPGKGGRSPLLLAGKQKQGWRLKLTKTAVLWHWLVCPRVHYFISPDHKEWIPWLENQGQCLLNSELAPGFLAVLLKSKFTEEN